MWEVEYYKKENGDCPVEEFLLALPIKQRMKAIRQIDLLEARGTKLREPHAKHIKGKLWELRIKFAKDIQRVFYFAPNGSKFVLLHGYVKKTNKAPTRDLVLAESRLKDYERRCAL
ncbi:MAG: type II toxin-antitoxin system RelE/ParE family toxin [Coriobacteriia bacterium]|nr:type II toxin-antitoxin system RelE/ParE family toxin [Coriobacteriia bacterium]